MIHDIISQVMRSHLDSRRCIVERSVELEPVYNNLVCYIPPEQDVVDIEANKEHACDDDSTPKSASLRALESEGRCWQLTEEEGNGDKNGRLLEAHGRRSGSGGGGEENGC
jgi:hypothetical protein